MDGSGAPVERAVSSPPAICTPASNVGRLRALFTSSSNHDQQEARPQTDGQVEKRLETTNRRQSRDSQRSSLSQRVSDHLESLGAKLNGTAGTQTIVHRADSRQRKSPQFVISVDTALGQMAHKSSTTPSTHSSYIPTKHNVDWSPLSTASTAATSWTSPGSSGRSTGIRYTPEKLATPSKSTSAGADEGFLPPIQEDSSRFLVIPVQEEPIEALPSIATVENVAAAKVYFETHFNKVLMEPTSPRCARLKKLEQKMADLGLSHGE